LSFAGSRSLAGATGFVEVNTFDRGRNVAVQMFWKIGLASKGERFVAALNINGFGALIGLPGKIQLFFSLTIFFVFIPDVTLVTLLPGHIE
jgi:hypothetical protein